jgi:hypothetical protein
MKFWKEPIACFSLTRHWPLRKQRFQQFSVTTRTSVLNCCLATIGGYTDRDTDFPLIRHGPHRKWCLQQFFCRCGSVVGWGTMLKTGKSRVRVPMTWIFFFNWRNPSIRTVALGSSQPLIEMNTRSKGRPARKADKLTAISEQIAGTSTSHNPMGLHGRLEG